MKKLLIIFYFIFSTVICLGQTGTLPGPSIVHNAGYLNIRDFGGIGDGQTDTAISITSGTNTITSAYSIFSTNDVGKNIRVGGAGVAGTELYTTIASYISATQITIAVNASTTVSAQGARWGTDNTSALKAALSAAAASNYNSQTIFFPIGRYFFWGAPDSTSSTVSFPVIGYSSLGQKSIQLLGATPPTYFIDFANYQYPSNTGVLLEDMRYDSASNFIGSGGSASIYGVINYLHVFIENITFRTKSKNGNTDIKPLMSGLRLGKIDNLSVKNVKIETESSNFSSVQPDSLTMGLECPLINNGGFVWLENVQVQRYWNDLFCTENVVGDNVWLIASYKALMLTANSYHPAYFKKILIQWSKYNIWVGPTNPTLNVQMDFLDCEEYGTAIAAVLGNKWYNYTYDIFFQGNISAYSSINFFRVLANVGQDDRLTTNIDGTYIGNPAAGTNQTSTTTAFNIKSVSSVLPRGYYVNTVHQYLLQRDTTVDNVYVDIDAGKFASLSFRRKGIDKWGLEMDPSVLGRNDFAIHSFVRNSNDIFIDSVGSVVVGGGTSNYGDKLQVNGSSSFSLRAKFGAPSAGLASANFAPGTFPTTPNDGDFGHVTGHLYFRDGSTTYDLLSPGGGLTTVAFSNTANTNGGSISGSTLTLTAADGTHPGGIQASGSQTLAPILTMPAPLFTGLTSGAATDSILTINPSTGQVRRIAQVTDTLNAWNGLTLSGSATNDTISLGGTLAKNTTLNGAGFNLVFSNIGQAQSIFTASNANLTLSPGGNNGMIISLPAPNAARTITLSSPAAGQTYEFQNFNSPTSGGTWTFSTSVGVTNVPYGRSKFYYDGSVWNFVSNFSPNIQFTTTGVVNVGTSLASSPSGGIAYDATYRVGGWVKVTSFTAGFINLLVGFTDETNTFQTITLVPVGGVANIAATGYYVFPTIDIRVKAGTQVITQTSNSGVGALFTYDAGATITLLSE